MFHKLNRLKAHILSHPQLATQETLDAALAALDSREGVDDLLKARQQARELYNAALAAGDFEMAFELNTEYNLNRETVLSEDGKIAKIDVIGPLAHRASMFEGLCGARSYQSLVRDVKAAAAIESVNTIVLNIDSGGGEASGAFDTARTIRQIASESGKKLVVYSDGLVASAAYALACAADEIIISESASVGSIGVIMTLQNIKGKLDKEGIKVLPVFAGDKKALGHPALDLSEEDLAIVQSRVDALFGMFANLVSEMRGISTESIVDMQALTFLGQDALAKGLVDKIMSAEDFKKSLGEEEMALDFGGSQLSTNKAEDNMSDQLKDNVANAEALESALAKLADMEALVASKSEALAYAENLLKEKAEAELDARMQAFIKQGESLSTYGIDAQAFANEAINASPALLDMFAKVVASTNTQLDASAAMAVVGVSGEGQGALSDEERLLKAMQQQYSK